MTVTIADIKKALSTYKDDMEVVITDTAGHECCGSAGTYRAFDEFMESFTVAPKTLVDVNGSKDYVAIKLNSYGDDLFNTTDNFDYQFKDVTVSEMLAKDDELIVDPTEFASEISNDTANEKSTKAEIAKLEQELIRLREIIKQLDIDSMTKEVPVSRFAYWEMKQNHVYTRLSELQQ